MASIFFPRYGDIRDDRSDDLREFVSGTCDCRLLRIAAVESNELCTLVEKHFWLKYDPQQYPYRVSTLDWEGTPVQDVVLLFEPKSPEELTRAVWVVGTIVREESLVRGAYEHGCYYDEEGDSFDPDNAANWDGDQQIGFRD